MGPNAAGETGMTETLFAPDGGFNQELSEALAAYEESAKYV